MKHHHLIPTLYTADPPRITSHPKTLKDVVAGKPAVFTVQVIGTKPLSYQWKHKPSSGIEGWQVCDVERFLGADSSTLTIPSAQMLDEGSYYCTVSNCVGSDISDNATLTIGELKFLSLHNEYMMNCLQKKVLKQASKLWLTSRLTSQGHPQAVYFWLEVHKVFPFESLLLL